ncbi:DNA topoisomerase 1 beta-like [Aegilops tauschii subsp. strangulata]|uniref:DNA topoisomerase I n=1 Tax=Aegilops tauschii TaxID=37682 RepID=M8BT37_AEGTA|nr:DNA topoisomerase 1 beta-like [Aegilops tauschii subsp. strangulata]
MPDGDSEDERPIALRKNVHERKLKIINAGGAKADGHRHQDSDDEKPLAARLGINSAASKTGGNVSDDDSEDGKPLTARFSRKRTGGCSDQTVSALKKARPSDASDSSSVESEPKDEPEHDGRKKWSTLVHNGVVFPPPYKPHGVKMLYNGQPVDLTPEQEEVATMFAVMKDTEYASKETFINNFFTDWRKILGKTHVITKFELCDFTPIYEWHLSEKEKKKQMTSEEKKASREEKSQQDEKFMWAFVDGVKEKVGNFRVEPPGLFRGRGEHPKMGRLKRRIRPSDITINIGEEAPVPVCPIPGESWKEVKHDNTVTWLACWNDPINEKDIKYVFLAASSSLKGQSDKEKYEKARKLKDYIRSIRANYTKDFRSKDQRKKQIAVATYLIDKLALRAGDEKDEDEADTVGCCTLKVENVTCLPPNKLQFDFLGKDSIRYYNTVEVELAVYEAIKEFCAGKKKGGHVFDKLDTTKLNAHLKDLMPGLTAKVFRTYDASITLDTILNKETTDGTVDEKAKVYQRANKEVAIICNHQRAVPKSHDSQMNKLNEKIDELTAQRDQLNVELEKANKLLSKKAKKRKLVGSDGDAKRRRKLTPEMLQKKLSQVETRIVETDNHKNNKEDLKTVALGTSKINYLDPRITVAWCKTHEVPIDRDKIFTKTILEKFACAMDVDPDFRF